MTTFDADSRRSGTWPTGSRPGRGVGGSSQAEAARLARARSPGSHARGRRLHRLGLRPKCGSRSIPRWISIAQCQRHDTPGDFPFTRGIHPTMYRGRLWTMRQFAGFGTARGHQRTLQVPARARARPDSRSRSTFPTLHGLRLRIIPARRAKSGSAASPSPALARHGDPLRRHPARPGLDLDDHQRPGGDALLLLRRGGGAPGRGHARSSGARSRTTS